MDAHTDKVPEDLLLQMLLETFELLRDAELRRHERSLSMSEYSMVAQASKNCIEKLAHMIVVNQRKINQTTGTVLCSLFEKQERYPQTTTKN